MWSSQSAFADCYTSSTKWKNSTFSQQSGKFTAEFDAIPQKANSDALTALSIKSATSVSKYAVLVRFNDQNKIDARNGGQYKANTNIDYTAGKSYHFRLIIDVANHKYSAYVTPEGGSEQALATDYAFRTEQATVSKLTNWGLWASTGSHQVCNFNITSDGSGESTTSTPTLTLAASPNQVTSGSSSTLNWTTTNADSCAASGDWTGTKGTSGAETANTITANKSYTLTCTGTGGSVAKTAQVSVQAAAAPTLTLAASPTQVTSGSSTSLSWTATNAQSCAASGGWTGTKAVSGTETTSNITANTSYTLTCTGAGGSVAKTAQVSVASISATDPCSGLLTDKANHPMTTLAKPALLQAVVDPQFGTTIRRISNAGTGHVVKPMYSTIPAWNADESYIILYHTEGAPYAGMHVLYNGKTYELIKPLNDTAADLEQIHWDPVDPNIFYYPSNYNNKARFIKYDVRTDTETLVHDFALAPTSCPNDGTLSFGSDPQYMSWDGNNKVVGLQCGSSKKISYNITTDTVLGTTTINSVNAPVAAPSGNLFHLDAKVYNPAFALQRTLVAAVVDEHASIGRKANGADVYNVVSFDDAQPGNLISYDLATGTRNVIIGPATGYPYTITGTHISSVAIKNPGYVSVDMVGEGTGQTLLDNEIVLADLNGNRVCRVAHHHSKEGPQGYWAEPHSVISPSGTRILFGSDWGGTNTVDTFVVELPSYTNSSLSAPTNLRIVQ